MSRVPLPHRGVLAFRAVNRRGTPGHDAGLQRHHLLPRQLLSQRCFGPLFGALGRQRLGFDDFRHNGLLLPANDEAAVRMALPLHRGPHRGYNGMVIERVGQIEAGWARTASRSPDAALTEALMRLRLLQRALRRRLLSPARGQISLSRFDPRGRAVDFAELDALVDQLWPVTETSWDFASTAPGDMQSA